MVNIITDQEWTDTYQPIKNPIDPDASCDGEMFETYGADLDFVRQQNPAHIWTYADDDNGKPFIQSGYHLVNRIGYFVTKNPFDIADSVCVRID